MSHAEYIFVDPATLAMPASSGLYKVYKDRWWVLKEDKLVFYAKLTYPLCNHTEGIAKYLAERISKGLQVRQIPFVFVPSKIEEIL